jgi:DNA primase
LEGGLAGPQTFTVRNMAARIEAVGDLWADMRRRRRSLLRPLAKLKTLTQTSPARGNSLVR